MSHLAAPVGTAPSLERRVKPLSLIVVTATVACVLAIQFGYTSHLSVAGACFVLAVLTAIRKLNALWFALAIIGASVMILPHLFMPDEFHLDGLYRSLREAACFFMIVSLKRVRFDFTDGNKTAIKWGLWVLMIALLVMTTLQTIDLQLDRTGRFFVPSMYYPATINSTDCWTSSACWLDFEKLHGIRIVMRPCATFAEPSYLGFVVVCLVFVGHKLLADSRREMIAFMSAAMATVLMAQTASGILALVVMFLVLNKQSPLRTLLVVLVTFLFLSVAFVFMSNRWNDISDGSDSSSRSRLTQPLSAAGETLAQGYVFGLPSESLGKVVPADLIPGARIERGASDNALINIFLQYGAVGGTIVLLILLLRCSAPEVCLLLLSMQFNGAFFWYDKVVLLALALILTKARFGRVDRRPTPPTAHYS
ncbi:hypothetical protein [Caballeronia sp. Lep1P3]|uniref:hypothetical protein n=1 Tax=Caballeronia sp. Lep1P3 TaxID=2878150 RepID=UPI001FD20111|nr:hypothetical protein [Caballeronia sp. Lep1P3]